MKKLRILVDMDEVLDNLLDGWVAYLNERYGVHADAKDIRQWSLTCVFPFLTEEETIQPLYEDAFHASLAPKPHSVEYLHKMISDGHEVFVVTAASVYQTVPAKMDWLFAHYPYLSWENVMIARRKQLIQGDVLIDDGIHNLEGGNYFKILYDCPYNQSYNAEANGMVRVYSLKEAYEVINGELLKE